MLRLRSAADFERVRREGRSHAHPLVVLIACRRGPGQPAGPARCGFTAGRSVGSAVKRNRAKRLLRAAVRTRSPQLPEAWDFVFIARAPLAGLGLTEAQAAVDRLIGRFRPEAHDRP